MIGGGSLLGVLQGRSYIEALWEIPKRVDKFHQNPFKVTQNGKKSVAIFSYGSRTQEISESDIFVEATRGIGRNTVIGQYLDIDQSQLPKIFRPIPVVVST